MSSARFNLRDSLPLLSRRGFIAGTGGLALVTLAGCRSAVDDSGGGDGAGEEGDAPKHIVVATPGAPDPTGLLHRQPDTPGYINLVFDRLVDLDPDSKEPIPWLATEWEWSDDRMELTLSLRDDVTWHSGREFTADDVVFTLEAAQDPEASSQVAGILERIDSVEPADDHTVVITLAEPTSNIFDALAFNPIVDSETYDDADSGEEVIGTGPFTWESFTPGEELEVKAFEDYWGGKPPIESITIKGVENAEALISGLQSEQMDLIGGVPGRDLGTLEDDENYTLMSVESSYQQTYLAADVQTAPFDDPKVRQALQYAVDRERIVEQVYGGFGNVSCVPWGENTPGVTDDQVTRYGLDLDKATELIEEAGASGAEVTLYAASNPIFDSVMEIVEYGLTEIGLNVTTKSMEDTDFGERLRGKDLPGLFIANVGLVSVSPITGISAAAPLHPDNNPSNVDSDEYRELQARAYEASSDEETEDANYDLGEYLLDESFHITLAQAFETYAMSSDLSGVEANVLGYIKLDEAD